MNFVFAVANMAAALSVVVAVLAVLFYRPPGSLFFLVYSIFIAAFCVAHALELSAATINAALLARRIQYFGIPFIVAFYFLFSKHYCKAPIKNAGQSIALLTPCLPFALLALSWPSQKLFFNAFSFSAGPVFSSLSIKPGLLYPYAQFYVLAILGLCLGYIIYHYIFTGGLLRRDLFVYLAATLPVFAGQLQQSLAGGEPASAMAMALALNAGILALYMLRYRPRQRRGLGREVVVQSMKDGYILLDTHGHYLDANRAAHAFFPCLKSLVPGSNVQGLAHFPSALLDELEDSTEFTLTQGEHTLYVKASRSPVLQKGRLVGIALLLYDNTQTQNLINELQELATYDTLTGLYNRGSFFTYAARDYSLAMRKGEDGSILMLDIDHFKNVNDSYGHQMGDKVLAGIAAVLRAQLRHTDICGRYGGEEMVIWLADAAQSGAEMIAAVLCRAVEKTQFSAGGQSFNVTISIGVACICHARHKNFEQLLGEADSALYQAKSEGRNCVRGYKPRARMAPPAMMAETAEQPSGR